MGVLRIFSQAPGVDQLRELILHVADQLRFEPALPVLPLDPFRNGKRHGGGRIAEELGAAAQFLGQEIFGLEHVEVALQRTPQADHVTRHQIRQLAAIVGMRDADRHQVAAGIDDLPPARCPSQ